MYLEKRTSGISLVGDLPWGSHFCLFYRMWDDLLDILLPYFMAGLRNNELCTWVASDTLACEDRGKALKKALSRFRKYADRGQMEMIPYSRWRAREGAVVSQLDRAISLGFDGLRLAFDAFPGGEDDRTCASREVETIRRYNVLALFAYPRDMFDAPRLMDVIRNHHFVLVRDEDRWEVIQSSEARVVRDELKRSEERLRSLFSNMSEGFAYCRVVLDAGGKPADCVFLETNDAFERLTGLEGKNVIGKRVTEVLPGIEKDPADWIGKLGKVALTGEPTQFEGYAAPLNRWYSVSAFGTHRGFFAVTFSEITERKKAEEKITRLTEELKKKISDVSGANVSLRNSRLAALNLLDDAVEARKRAEEANRKLELEIAERKRAEEELKRYREHLEEVVEDRTRDLIAMNDELEREITERKSAEAFLSKTNTLLRLFAEKVSRKDYLDAATSLIANWSGCRHVGVRVADPSGNIPYESSFGFSDEFLASECVLALGQDQCACTRVIIGEADPLDGPCMTQNGSFYTSNISKFVEGLSEPEKERFRGVCVNSGFLTVAVIPIRHGDCVIGAIHLADEREGILPPQKIAFLEQTALVIGEAVHRFSAEEELRRSQEELRALSAHLQTVREEERTRISREIHDELGQALTALKMDVAWLSNTYKDHEQLFNKTKSMLDVIDSTIRSVKRIITELRPGILDHLGLVAAMEWFSREFKDRMGIGCDISFSHENIELDREIATTVFRIFQEALTNVARHAEATKVTVSLEHNGGVIALTVRDNGKGITEEQLSASDSFGLLGIKERANYWGGEISIAGEPGKGTTVTAVIPIPQDN